MAPSADILPASVAGAQHLLNEKAPTIAKLTPVTNGKHPSLASASSPLLQARSVSSFELEDHPIDVIHKIRVCVFADSNLKDILLIQRCRLPS